MKVSSRASGEFIYIYIYINYRSIRWQPGVFQWRTRCRNSIYHVIYHVTTTYGAACATYGGVHVCACLCVCVCAGRVGRFQCMSETKHHAASLEIYGNVFLGKLIASLLAVSFFFLLAGFPASQLAGLQCEVSVFPLPFQLNNKSMGKRTRYL